MNNFKVNSKTEKNTNSKVQNLAISNTHNSSYTKTSCDECNSVQKKFGKIIGCVICTLILLAAVPLLSSFADSSILTPGANQIKAGEKYSFRINLEDLKSEYAEASKSFTVKVTISPNPEAVSISPNVNVHQYGSSYTISSADISDISAVNFAIHTSSAITEATNYTVNVSVAGEASTPNATCSFTVIPNNDAMNGSQKGGFGGSGGSTFYSGSSTTTSSTVYEGSWDNYLDSLSVSGYDFTQKFNKTRDTYFVSVQKDVKKLTVKASASDSSAVVRITGQDNISSEKSKILISVTADNGDVRYYRIYVTHDTEAENE